MLRVIQFLLSDEIGHDLSDTSLDYGIFPPYWANYLLRHEVNLCMSSCWSPCLQASSLFRSIFCHITRSIRSWTQTTKCCSMTFSHLEKCGAISIWTPLLPPQQKQIYISSLANHQCAGISVVPWRCLLGLLEAVFCIVSRRCGQLSQKVVAIITSSYQGKLSVQKLSINGCWWFLPRNKRYVSSQYMTNRTHADTLMLIH